MQNGHDAGHVPPRPLPLPTGEPWARLPGEGAKAYAAFLAYRDLPPSAPDPHAARSLRNLGRQRHVSRQWLSDWSRRYAWVQRTAAWDSAQVRVRQEAHFAALAAMSHRQAEAAERTQAALSVVTEALLRRLAADPEGTTAALEALPLPRLVALCAAVQGSIGKAAALERLARGAETVRIAVPPADPYGLEDAVLSDPAVAELTQALVCRLMENAAPVEPFGS